jgi:D-sedoheptulose 7-phosphate isomerase
MNSRIEELLTRYPILKDCQQDITKALNKLVSHYQKGNKLLICGNGGSASDSDHIAGELLKGFGSKRPLSTDERALYGEEIASNLQGSLPTIPLPNLSGLISAYSNDVNAEYVYAQLVHGLGVKDDMLLALSTSGNSKNVLHAVDVANAKGLITIGLTGQNGGKLKTKCAICICVPENEVFKIQELHLPIYHSLCLAVEAILFDK